MTHEQPTLSSVDGRLRLTNGVIELGFDAQGALESVVDRASGWEFLRDRTAPRSLFLLALRRPDRELDWFASSQGTRFAWRVEEGAAHVVLELVVSGFPGQALTVTVRVELAAGAALSRWRMRVDGLGDAAVYRLVCPVLSGAFAVGNPAPGEALAVARQGEGYVFHDPFPVVDGLPLKAGPGPESPAVGTGEVHGMYPGAYPLQLMLAYWEAAGLYLACHDAAQQVKGFDAGKLPGLGDQPVLSISHYPSEAMGGAADFTYDTVVGVFHGDWHDGAAIYRDWARAQWWCAQRLRDRDLPPWLRAGFAVFQMQNYDIPVLSLTHPLAEIAALVNRLSAEVGVPLLALVFNFENGGAWTGPKGYFPPREGEAAFHSAMASLRAAGNRGFVYMPGGNWYIAITSYTPPFDSWAAFEAEGRPAAVVDAKGNVAVAAWYSGWHGARLCPAAPFTVEMTEELFLGCVERGSPVVQIDNFPCGGADACYSGDHGHPPGYGPWWSEEWAKILAGVRTKARALDPDAVLATEGISEGFIPWVDLFDQRAGNMEYFGHYHPGDPMGGELVPLFGFVYNEYIGAYCAAYPECSRPEVLYWTRCFGKSLVQGVIPTGGWYLSDTQALNPVTTAFFGKVARSCARECWKYVMFGEMLKPPRIEVPWVDFPYQRLLDLIEMPAAHPEVRHVVRDRAVEQGTFRAADGAIGHILVNVTREPVAFDVALERYGSQAATFDVEAVVDGQRRPLRFGVALPRTERVCMEPLSVTLLEVVPSQCRPSAPSPDRPRGRRRG